MGTTPIAYLAQGRLCFKTGADPARSWESRFGQSLHERAVEIRQRHSWKESGRGAQFMGRGLLWAGAAPENLHVAVTSLTRCDDPGAVLYALETPQICGVFVMKADGEERRLTHTNEGRRVRHLCSRADMPRVACAVLLPDGSANIAVMSKDAGDLAEVTEGDSVDLAPSWVPGEPDQLVFQSAPIGRNRSGAVVTHGPYAIQKIDLARGEVTQLHEEKGCDLLGPQVGPDGSLYFIRRPFTTVGGGSFWRSLLDFVLFPFRLLYALFQYLNFFTARYTGRPLTTAGGPERKGADARQMLIWGNLIEAEAEAAQGGPDEDRPGIVPSSWQLVRRTSDGRAETLASGVLSFDIAATGEVVYSNGTSISRRFPDGRTERLHTDAQIEQVVALSC